MRGEAATKYTSCKGFEHLFEDQEKAKPNDEKENNQAAAKDKKPEEATEEK